MIANDEDYEDDDWSVVLEDDAILVPEGYYYSLILKLCIIYIYIYIYIYIIIIIIIIIIIKISLRESQKS